MTDPTEVKLDFHNKKPIAEQLTNELRRLILEGIYPPGIRLPTVRHLAALLQVNFNTVARVYRALDQQGLISTQQGRGSYVLESSQVEKPTYHPIHKEQIERIISDLFENAERLKISPQEIHAALKRRLHLKNRQTSSTPRKKLKTQTKRRLAPIWVRELSHPDPIIETPKHRRRMKRS